MKRITDQAGNALVISIVAVLVVGGVGIAGWYVYRHQHQKTTSSAAAVRPADTNPSPNLTAGTDNASLESDLSNIDGSMNQAASAAKAAGSALNDQQNEIQVPTE